MRLYDVTESRIRIDAQDIAAVTQASLRRQIAVVAPGPMLFHRTLHANSAYAKSAATRAEIERVARLANACDFIVHRLEGFRRWWQRGMKLLAASVSVWRWHLPFLSTLRFFALDEAASTPDSHSEELIQDAMHRLTHGRIRIVIALHDRAKLSRRATVPG